MRERGNTKPRRGRRGRIARPSIFNFDHYRPFFTEYFKYLRETRPGFSLRSFSTETGVSPTYFSFVMNGKVKLSEKTLKKFIDHLGFTESEKSYLRQMRLVVDGESSQDRVASLKSIIRFKDYQRRNFDEAEVSKYLSEWYYVAIRNLAKLPGFTTDIDWIQKQLTWKITPQQIQEALDFLIEHKYIIIDAKGRVTSEGRQVIERQSKIYQTAMAKYHTDMLKLAGESIFDVDREKRQLDGYTFSISEANFPEIRKILDETLKRISKIEDRDQKKDSVYQVTLSCFPLARKD